MASMGGRSIWQLADSNDLLVAWRANTDERTGARARDIERELIADFKLTHGGKRPFANVRD